jgi:5-formyltetrahydrofolate cyclo-ligase
LNQLKKTKNLTKKKIDLILTPGIAFDIHGNRVGYGRGYYDKFISKMKNSIKIGIAYDFQIIKQIKEEDYDIPMNFIISEKRKINCKILTNKND